MALVLGIDAGFQALGIVVVRLQPRGDGVVGYERLVLHGEAVKTERTSKKRGIRVADDDAERCQQLAQALKRVIETWKPAGAVVELPHGGAQGARANRAMGMATGVVTSALSILDVPTEWVTPGDVKKAATGRKDGSKEAVQEAVQRMFRWHDGTWPKQAWAREHVADAAAAVLAAQGGTLMRMIERMVEGRN